MRHPIHVMMLSDSIGFGGAEQLVWRLACSLDPERYRRSVCVSRPATLHAGGVEHAERLRAAGVEVIELPRATRADVFAWSTLVRFLVREKVDVLHAHKFGSNVWAGILGTLARVPLTLAHEHTWSFEGEPVRRAIDRHLVARLCDAFIAVSEADRRRMHEVVGIPRHRIVHIPNGIPPLPNGDRDLLRDQLGLSTDATVLVALAHLRPQKALPVMLEAVALARHEIPGIRLLIAGGGNPGAVEEHVAAAERLHLGETVTFLGLRRDVENVLAAGDVAVSSSDFEGSPLALMECMAAGLPVVATAVGGVPELVQDGETGILVPRRDPAALAAAIVRLARDPNMRRRLGERGRSVQQTEFSLAAMTRRLEQLYEARLQRR